MDMFLIKFYIIFSSLVYLTLLLGFYEFYKELPKNVNSGNEAEVFKRKRTLLIQGLIFVVLLGIGIYFITLF